MAGEATLVPLARSSSSRSSRSSLTSDEITFDHTAPTSEIEPGSGKEPTLGLRELASMALSGLRQAEHSVDVPQEIRLLKALGPEPETAPFARAVEIKGWKVVGGKSWTDQGKVGAYVGRKGLHFDPCIC